MYQTHAGSPKSFGFKLDMRCQNWSSAMSVGWMEIQYRVFASTAQLGIYTS